LFSIEKSGEPTRTRHFDLQCFFKEGAQLTEEQRQIARVTRRLFDSLNGALAGARILRNRAITVSTVILAWTQRATTIEDARPLITFLTEFLVRLRWQVGKDVAADPQYYHLIEFQRHLTQASVEKPAVAARSARMELELDSWRRTGALTGDREYREAYGRDPAEVSREAVGAL
jgi:hypothetical protein